MFNKKQIIEILKKYDFNINNYIVISGAAMVLLGIKDTTKDIDISVTKEYYDYLLDNYSCVIEGLNKYSKKVYFIDDVINFGCDYYTTDHLEIDGIPVQKPGDIIKLKKFLDRDKDKNDIELINMNLNR